MEFVIGFLGAILAVVIFLAGVAAGWKLQEYDASHTQKITAEELTVEQKQRIKEEREAWNRLHNYSAEDAYGMTAIMKPEVK